MMLFGLCGVREAAANPMDLAPERLKTCDATVGIPCGEWRAQGASIRGNYFQPDKSAWAKLMSQYAMAIAPTAMHPARTTGYGGFEMSLFATATTVSRDEDFMKKGTEGAISEGKFPSSNASPDGVLQIFGVTGRKGLPYGFELQGSVGYIANTELVSLGGGIRWSVFEGFRKGALGAVPDVSVGGYVNTLTGSSKVKMTVPALDVQISKPFTVADQLTIQPYLGWQMVWITADSSVVDGTPAIDGLGKCNARPAIASERTAGDTGEFHCQDRGPGVDGKYSEPAKGSIQDSQKLDLNNNMVFPNIRFRRQRAMVGVLVRYEIAHLLLHVMTDIVDPESGGDERIKGLAKQWTFGLTSGVSF
ncbi:MAG: hypothetical protein NVS3B20_06150 [Polyangiales bacterium]